MRVSEDVAELVKADIHNTAHDTHLLDKAATHTTFGDLPELVAAFTRENHILQIQIHPVVNAHRLTVVQ